MRSITGAQVKTEYTSDFIAMTLTPLNELS